MIKKILPIIVIIIILIISFIAYKFIPKYKEEQKIKNATIIVELKDTKVNFNDKIKISDLIENINGKIIDDKEIDTTIIGTNKVKFSYVNDEDIKVPYEFEIEVLDTTAPIIWLSSSYTVTTSFNGKLSEKIMCADDTDDTPICEIEGSYDTTKVGSYPLKYVAKDKYGNTSSKSFTLYVKKPSKSSNYQTTKIPFDDFTKKYKTDDTLIGIDISSWQGNIDYDKVKNAGVEFAIIRIGSKNARNEHYLDAKFKQNIEGFNRVGIPVGIYYYSYTNDYNNSIDDAKWVISELKDYKVDLPIAFDWENWSNYNSYHVSRYSLTKNAKAFLDTVKSAGYDGLLYSSKSYLDQIWMDTGYEVWLAHYISKTSYTGKYKYWQVSASGKVDGIDGDVDLDIMYKKGVNYE